MAKTQVEELWNFWNSGGMHLICDWLYKNYNENANIKNYGLIIVADYTSLLLYFLALSHLHGRMNNPCVSLAVWFFIYIVIFKINILTVWIHPLHLEPQNLLYFLYILNLLFCKWPYIVIHRRCVEASHSRNLDMQTWTWQNLLAQGGPRGTCWKHMTPNIASTTRCWRSLWIWRCYLVTHALKRKYRHGPGAER